MKLSLPKIAIWLSIFAIIMHIWYPIDRYFRDIHEEEMVRLADRLKPHFVLESGDFSVRHTYSSLYVWNLGDGDAHNIRVGLLFQPVNRSFPGHIISQDWQNYVWKVTEVIPKIPSRGYFLVFFPIGEYHLKSVIPVEAEWNFTNYEADVSISCTETETVSRHYIHTQFQP